MMNRNSKRLYNAAVSWDGQKIQQQGVRWVGGSGRCPVAKQLQMWLWGKSFDVLHHLMSCWSHGIPHPDPDPAAQPWPSRNLAVALVLLCSRSPNPRCFSGMCVSKASRLQEAKGRAVHGKLPSLLLPTADRTCQLQGTSAGFF